MVKLPDIEEIAEQYADADQLPIASVLYSLAAAIESGRVEVMTEYTGQFSIDELLRSIDEEV